LILSVSGLFGQTGKTGPLEEINNWAEQQTENFDANNVVNFLNGNKAEGDITFGSEYVFNSDWTEFISATTLDATHFVVAYRDYGNSSRAFLI